MKEFAKRFLAVIIVCLCGLLVVACGKKENNDTPTVCAHTYTSITTKIATCKEPGIKTYTCTICFASYTEDIEKLDSHSYKSEITQESTCKESGIKTYSCNVCGDSYTEEIARVKDHSYKSEITQEATCKEKGIKTYSCNVCGDSYTEEIARVKDHSYKCETTKAATCKESGIKTYTCTVCGDSYMENVLKLAHSFKTGWNGAIIYTIKVASTCQKTGVKVKQCGICDSEIEEIIPTIDHKLSKNNLCNMCGLNCDIKLDDMSEEEKMNASSVKSYSTSNYAVAGLSYGINIRNDKGEAIAVPAILDITVTNKNNQIVYSNIKKISTKDFTFDKYDELEYRIMIDYNEFSNINLALSSVEISIFNPAYFSFEPNYTIPPAIFIIPSDLPTTIYRYGIDTPITGVKINNIRFGWSGSSPKLYFSGEKIYDAEGETYSRSCYVGFKIYDMEGNLVSSGNYLTEALSVGETFKEDAIYPSDLENGKIYRLEILNVG